MPLASQWSLYGASRRFTRLRRGRWVRAMLGRSFLISVHWAMADGTGPVRRSRQENCIPVDGAVLVRQLPRGRPSVPTVTVGDGRQGPGFDMDRMFRSFTGTDVLATVASFLNMHVLRGLLCLARQFCDQEDLWVGLLRWASRSVFALSVTSARARIAFLKSSPHWMWSRDVRDSYAQLSHYRWCLDLSYCGSPVFSAVIPLREAPGEDRDDADSCLESEFPCGNRIANLLPRDQLPSHVLRVIRDAWCADADPELRPGGWVYDLEFVREFRRGEKTCSLWLFDLDSREVVAGVCRDAWWDWQSSCVRFFVTPGPGPIPVREASGDDSASSSDETLHETGRVLEAWIPLECRCDLEGTYDLACSTGIFVADTSDHPRDLLCERARRRADSDGLISALRECASQSAIPDVEV